MNKPTPIRVSHSRSGFNIYMPLEATSQMPAARYSVEVRGGTPDGSLLIRLFPHEGKNRMSQHADPERPWRLTVRELRGTGTALFNIDQFGIMDVSWAILTNTKPGDAVLEAYVPRSSDWPAPRNQRPRTKPSGRQLKLKLEGKAPTETHHARLGRVLRELNDLLNSGEVDDVSFRVAMRHDERPEVTDYRPGVVGSVTARLVKEETFG